MGSKGEDWRFAGCAAMSETDGGLTFYFNEPAQWPFGFAAIAVNNTYMQGALPDLLCTRGKDFGV
jgi:hypothetical protein